MRGMNKDGKLMEIAGGGGDRAGWMRGMDDDGNCF